MRNYGQSHQNLENVTDAHRGKDRAKRNGEELSKAHLRLVTLDKAVEQFRTKMIADGSTPKHVSTTLNKIDRICSSVGIESLPENRIRPT